MKEILLPVIVLGTIFGLVWGVNRLGGAKVAGFVFLLLVLGLFIGGGWFLVANWGG